MVEKLDSAERENIIASLGGWTDVADRDAISKSFQFSDFKTAFAFMTACALKAEQMNHHPEWYNVYATVDVVLSTHDANGVTEKDIELAAFMNATAQK